MISSTFWAASGWFVNSFLILLALILKNLNWATTFQVSLKLDFFWFLYRIDWDLTNVLVCEGCVDSSVRYDVKGSKYSERPMIELLVKGYKNRKWISKIKSYHRQILIQGISVLQNLNLFFLNYLNNFYRRITQACNCTAQITNIKTKNSLS